MSDEPSDRRRTFDRLFTGDPDPWDFESSAYEALKRKATLAVLFPDRFGRGLEIGCANGVLTAQLATICDHVLAIDISDVALELAASRVRDLDNVSLAQAEVPRGWPEGTFDLIVLSEILYFLSAEEIAQVARLAWASLSDQGTCLLVNWTGPNDQPIDGETACAIFIDQKPWLNTASEAWPSFRIDRLHKTGTTRERSR
jgi:SAM-dependent methyltransferase